jgi:excisionase family DNA binding protein
MEPCVCDTPRHSRSFVVPEPLLISVRQAAAELPCGRDTMYELIRQGRIRSVRIGRRLLVPRTELEAFVERETSELS